MHYNYYSIKVYFINNSMILVFWSHYLCVVHLLYHDIIYPEQPHTQNAHAFPLTTLVISVFTTPCKWCSRDKGGCNGQSIGSTYLDAIVRNWLWSTATESCPLGHISSITAIDPTNVVVNSPLATEDFTFSRMHYL